jgi:hypothetical protein
LHHLVKSDEAQRSYLQKWLLGFSLGSIQYFPVES